MEAYGSEQTAQVSKSDEKNDSVFRKAGRQMNLKDIANEAGVSTATVSNVINGNFHKVSQETIGKVQKIIEENDYKPNTVARSLARKESKIIGYCTKV